MGLTKFKLLTQRLLSGLGKTKTFFPFYDSENDADYRVSLDTLITFISNELGVSSKAVFELTGVTKTGNNYVSTLDISSYRTEGLYIFKPSEDSDDATTLNVNSVGVLDIKEFDGTNLVDKTDLKAVNTYLLLNKTSYWLIVGGVSGGSGGVSTFSALTDSPYDNTELATALNSKQDRLAGIVSGCVITVETFSGVPVATNKQIRVSKGADLTNSWYIPTSEYSKLADTVSAEITLCPTGGDFKYYDIVADNTNAVTIYEGTPSTAPAHYVIDPLTEVLLGFITVGDAVIEEPAVVVTSLTKKLEYVGVVTGSFTLNCESKDFPSFIVRLNGTAATLNFSNYWNVVEGTIYLYVTSDTVLSLPTGSYAEGDEAVSKSFVEGYYRVTFGYLYGEYFFDFGVANTGQSITTTVSSFQALNGVYQPSTTYVITDADVNLYGGNEIYFTTDNEGKLNERGIGKFYNPKYDQNVAGFNIWTNLSSFVATPVSGTWTSQAPPENITANNGATGRLFTTISGTKFIALSGDWSTATSITGDTTGATATLSGIVLRSYTDGDLVHWGGKTWERDGTVTNGIVGTVSDIYTLSADWIEIPFNSTDYNVSYDEIKYDVENDLIVYRNEKNSNIVSTNKGFNDYEGWNPIKDFMWGNVYDDSLGVGIGMQTITNSYNENLNFRGKKQYLVTFVNESFQWGVTFESINPIGLSTSQFNLYFSGQSGQSNLVIVDAIQSLIVLENRSEQANIILENATQNTLFFKNRGSQTYFFLNDKSQLKINIDGYSRSNVILPSDEIDLEFKGDLPPTSSPDMIYVKKDNQVMEISVPDLTALVGGGGSFQTLPTEVTGSLTAAIDKYYINTASATYTDPTGVQGKGFIVLVRGGTATVGGTAYTTGVIYRYYNSAAWSNIMLRDFATITGDITFTAGVGTIANNAVTNAKAAQMAANTVKGNNTGGTANASDLTTDQFTAMMENAVTVGTAGILTVLTSATYKYIRLTGCTGLGSIVAPSSSYKDLYIWNDTGVTLTLYNEYLTEATAANRIICGANQNWGNNTMLHLKYDVVEARWCLVTLEGSTYRPLLAGTGDRINQTSSTGQESATLTTQDIDFTPAQKTSATTGSWTGVYEITITGLKQGQYYADIAGGYNYECHVNDKCNRVPNVNLTPITTNLIYPLNEITGTSGTLIGDNSYILNNASQVVMALPATGVQGDVIPISGKGAGGWRVTVPNTQQIVGGLTNTLTNGSGYIQAGQYAAVTLKCITGGTAAVWEIICINPATTLTIV